MRSLLSKAFLAAAMGFTALARPAPSPQGPNTLAPYNENIRTMATNTTYFIVPIQRSTIASLVPYPLVPVPQDKTLFPLGFPTGMVPVLVSSAYDSDIRMMSLKIDSLTASSILVPYVDRLGDGKTPFIYALVTTIGGTDGNDLQGVVPTIAGDLESPPITLSTSIPDTAAYAQIGPNEFTSHVNQIILDNTLSGPSLEPSIFDLDFSTTSSPLYTPHTFHSLINQPEILSPLTCGRNNYYFNQTFTEGIMRTGTVTLYADGAPPSIAGVYKDLGGYSASAVAVGNNPQDCAGAAAQNDPFASD